MSDLRDRILKSSTVKEADVLTTSKIYNDKKKYTTKVPMVNVALSGSVNGGLTSGLTIFAGPSKHFKSAFALLMVKTYLDAEPDAICIFIDTEFGTPRAYFASFGIDMERVVHIPISDIEQMKHETMTLLNELSKNDKVIIVVDSVGNIASKKEVEDAIDGKSVADMTRAKQLKSYFRMVTPILSIKDIPMIVVNHVYQTMEMFSKAVVSGGTGVYYSADNIWIIGRQQDKDGKDLTGHHFIINIEKSRYVKEKSKIPITVSFNGGIRVYSGLFDIALELGYLTKNSAVSYSTVDDDGVIDEKKWKRKEIENNSEFWLDVLTNTKFAKKIEEKYSIAFGSIIQDDNEELLTEDV